MSKLDPYLKFLSGDEAVAQGAYEAGLEFAASYPGTPATEILEYLAKFDDIKAQWSVNEKVAYEVALGAAWGGVRSMFSAKHVGVNAAMDPLMTSAYTGVNAGFVLVSCDDPGMHSSQNEQDNRLIAAFAKMPLIEPSSPAEAYSMMKQAFDISENFDIPVMMRLTTRTAHSKENFSIGSRTTYQKKPFSRDIAKHVMVPSNAYKRHVLLELKLIKLKEFSEKCEFNRIEAGEKNLGIITSGVTYQYAKENYPDASYLKLGFTHPLPEEMIRKFASGVDEVFVLEENEPYLENAIKAMGIKIRSKHPTFRVGELRPELIPDVMAGKEKTDKPMTGRDPQLCPGCPHSAVFSVLKKLDLTVAGDIGCYTLGAAPPFSSLHTCLDMGSGVTLAEGFIRSGEKRVVGVIGDSTFVHSGITGLIDMAYNGVNGVIIILDNGTTAMTGNQPHPATGRNAKNKPTKKLSLENICKAAGADNVDVVKTFKVKELEKLISKRLTEKKLSVIIARHPCKLLEVL